MYQKFCDRSITVLLFTLLTILANGLSAQKIDSLIKVLNSSNEVDRYEALFGLAYEYSDVNDSLSMIYADKAYNLACKLGDSLRIIKGGRIKAGELRRLENIDEAIRVAQYVLQIARRHKMNAEIKQLLNSLANSYILKAEYDKALKYNFESLIIRESEGNKNEMSITFNNIGVIYYKLHDLNRAIEYYKKSLELKRQTNDKYDLDRLLINMGLCLNAIGDYEEARKFINEGLKECSSGCSDQIVLESHLGLGTSFFETKSYLESKKHFEKSYEVAKRIGNYRFQAENLVYFAKLDLIDQDYESAKKYLEETETISIQRGYSQLLITTYQLFSRLYQSIGDYKNTAFYQAKYIAFKDSVYSERLISNLAKVQTAYEERENIKTIAEKDQVVALQKEVITRKERQYIFIIAITCLIASLASALYYFTRRQQKINRELSKAKNKIEEQNERLESYNKELEVRVGERTNDLNLSNKALRQVNEELDNFIYKTSHDIRGPLATLKGMCNVALMDVNDELAISYLKKLDITADRMNTILTRLMIVNQINGSVMMPGKIDVKEIVDEIIAFERKKGLPPRFIISTDIQAESSIISDVSLVRIILENLIDNAIKFHTTSDRLDPLAKIKVSRNNAVIRVTVEDNGIGMGPRESKDIFQMFMRASERSEIGGIGLYLAKIASEKIGGQVSLVYSDSKGSMFEVIFPLDLNEVLNERSRSEQKLISLLERQTNRDQKSSTII